MCVGAAALGMTVLPTLPPVTVAVEVKSNPGEEIRMSRAAPRGGLSFLALMLALALASPALAGEMPPPAEYDRPYQGQLLITQVVTVAELTAFCRGVSTSACARVGVDFCHILMLQDEPASAEVLRHELAHCNGWPKDHPRPSPAGDLYRRPPAVGPLLLWPPQAP
jgi:hypothetical protein